MPNQLQQIWRFLQARPALQAFLAGLLIATGQVPISFLPTSIAGLVWSFRLFLSAENPKRALKLGWLVGFGYFVVTINWIVEPLLVDAARHAWMAPFALFLLPGLLATFWSVAFLGAKHLGVRYGNWGLAWAIALTSAEVARSYVLTGFPWGLLAYIWSETPAIHLAAFVGPHGLTLVTAALAVGTFWLMGRLPSLAAKPFAFVLIALVPLLGWMLAPPKQQLSVDRPIVRMIQPNAKQSEKWDPAMMPVFLNRQLAFTRAEATPPPDLIVWPESAIPVWLDQGQAVLEAIGRAAGDIPVVIGAQRSEGFRYYNSLATLRRGVVQEVYDKHHLVPFGEYFPLSSVAERLGLYGMVGTGFTSGPGPELISLGALGKGLPLICYEAVFPQQVGGAPERPDLLLQITNDGWFGEFAGPQQHLAQARFRSVEQGLPMVRVANTGISAIIAADGRILASLPLGKAGYLDAPVPSALPPTLYSRSGDLPIFLLLILGLISTQIRLRRKFV